MPDPTSPQPAFDEPASPRSATSQAQPMTPQPPDPIQQPELWRVWIAGYEAGQAAGIVRGRAEVVSAILPAAEAIAASQPSRGVAHEDLVQRRAAAAAAAPSLTPEEIRARAARSWGLPTASTNAASRGPGARRRDSDHAAADGGEPPERRRLYRSAGPTGPARGISR